MIHMRLSPLFWLYFLGGLLLLTACQENSTIAPSLIGTWTESSPLQPKGESVSQLTFDSNDTFVLKVSNFGVYEQQDSGQLSGWFEIRGKVSQQENTLLFIPEENTSWDSFYSSTRPKTEKTTQRLFDDCSFIVSGKRLELVYTTYPADAPESTRKTFYK